MSRVKVLLLCLILLAATTSVVLAQEPNYSISHWSSGSGSTLTGDGYRLSGIAGQPEAGAPLSGEGYTLTGGFKPTRISGEVPPDPMDRHIYLPIIFHSP